MIHHIKGTISHLAPSAVVVANSGIGYLLQISLSTYSGLKGVDSATVFTHLIVREDAQTLYGFCDIAEREMFVTLLGVSGVGPGNAINVLSYMSPSDVAMAAKSENKAAFRAVKGVGEKLSAQLVLDLKGKFKDVEIEAKPATATNEHSQEAVNALMSLGFNKAVSQKAVYFALNSGENTLDGIIRTALKNAK